MFWDCLLVGLYFGYCPGSRTVYLLDITGGFPKSGVPFLGGRYIKDYNILESILGSLYLGNEQLYRALNMAPIIP